MLGDTGGRGASRRRALPRPRRQARRSCRWSAAGSRSSPTSMPIPEKGTGAVKITPGARLQRLRGRQARTGCALDQHARHARRDALAATQTSATALIPTTSCSTSTASTASRRASASSRCSRSEGCSRRSRTAHATWCRTATAPAWSIEPCLTDQWYVDAEAAGRARRSRRCATGETSSCPKNWEKTYFHWMREHPALVHLAPALVGPPDPGLVRRRTATIFVARDEDEAQAAGARALRHATSR